MQFTVLIEFLVPGMATTLLLLYILLHGRMPTLPPGLPLGETANALLLLAVSYPVGILTNFPLFVVQGRLLSGRGRRRVYEKYEDEGIDLVALVKTQFGIEPAPKLPAKDPKKLEAVFHLMGNFVFSKNIDRFQFNYTFHEGVRRLARGILTPLILASYVVLRSQNPSKLLLGLFVVLAISAFYLLRHSVNVEFEQVVSYFLVLTKTKQPATDNASETASGAPTPAAKA